MRLVYLCKADPPPPNSDFRLVLEYFERIPEYLWFNSKEHPTQNSLWFADRVSGNWLQGEFNGIVVFVSERFVNDEKAMASLDFATKAIHNVYFIDFLNTLTTEHIDVLQRYTSNIYSAEEGIDALIHAFPNPNAEEEIVTKRLLKSIENEGYTFLSATVSTLEKQGRRNRLLAGWSYLGAFLFLLGGLLYTLLHYSVIKEYATMSMQILIAISFLVIIVLTLNISITRFLFLLGKSFMVESIRAFDRAHAIGLGKLYLQLYKDKFMWDELREVLQSWNIDKGSAFINLDARDIESMGMDAITSRIKKKDKV